MTLTKFKSNNQASANAPSSDNDERGYFDLHIRGIGYLNRLRTVEPKRARKGDAYLAVQIAAMEGDKNNPDYRYFDAIVVGETAKQLAEELEAGINDKDVKVLVGFTCGGVRPEIYQPKKGAAAGENRVSLKTRLLRLSWVKVKEPDSGDYETVYQAETTAEEEPGADDNRDAA